MRKHEADKLMMMIEKIFGLKVVMGGDARIWPIKNALSADGFQKGTFFHILRSNWLIAWKTRAFLPILRQELAPLSRVRCFSNGEKGRMY